MGKIAKRYLEVHPSKLIERGFHPDRNMVSESLFSLGNEYCGVRGFFEEGSTLPSLIGTYFNGIYEYALEETPNAYKGIAKRSHFTINSPNFLKVSISIDGVKLDLGTAKIKDFVRELDMDNGLMTRSFVWEINGKEIRFVFRRLLSMVHVEEAYQSIEITADEEARVRISFSIDGTILHWGNHCFWERGEEWDNGLYVKTPTTHQSYVGMMSIHAPIDLIDSQKEKETTSSGEVVLKAGKTYLFERFIANAIAKKEASFSGLKAKAEKALEHAVQFGFAGILEENARFFAEHYAKSNIEIEGNDEDQQGIRFCAFQLLQAYHGNEDDNNIGAKGLTGEAYSGHAFWDSETYCLPYYLFSDPKAAKNLLMFRYHTLDQARRRARDLDCEGACFPIATRNGEEACSLWQHASTQFQPTSAVAYAIYHYMNLYHDEQFMKDYGLEMLIEIAKCLYSRGQWNASHTHFGWYGVMGPDEFQVMVNHNTYTNYMGSWAIRYALGTFMDPRFHNERLAKRLGLTNELISSMEEAVDHTLILFDPKTKLFEQHAGYYDLPHIDVQKIPEEEFPLYAHWSYDRIYRNDMIKQPDVLMFMFLFNQNFDEKTLKANYEFYEPRCIHESSLSPSIHSILAAQLGKMEEASKFFGFATRLDLDDYNRNTSEGLHMTSIAAAWMNIVYGFLGLRSDKEILKIKPVLPEKWKKYRVNLLYHGRLISFEVKKDSVLIRNAGEPIQIYLGSSLVTLDGEKEFSL